MLNNDPTKPDTVFFGGFKKGSRPYGVNAQESKNIYANLSITPTPSLKIDLTALQSTRKRNIFFTTYLLSPDRVPRMERDATNADISIKWLTSTKLYFQAGLNYYSTNYQLMERSLFSKGSEGVLELSERYRGNTNFETYYMDFLLYDINRGFLNYQKSETNYITAHANFGWQFHKQHLLEAGMDDRQYTIRHASILDPFDLRPASGSNNIYGYKIDTSQSHYRLKPSSSSGLDGAKKPHHTSFFIQEQMESGILQYHWGLRWDYFDTGTKALRSLSDPTGQNDPKQQGIQDSQGRWYAGTIGREDFAHSKHYSKLSPRLGLSFEFLPGLAFRGNFGWYYQMPNFQEYYANSRFLDRASVIPFGMMVGNSNLKPIKNESIEAGLSYHYQNRFYFNLTHYWKNQKNIPDILPISSVPNMLLTVVNIEDNIIRGWDMSMEGRFDKHLSTVFHLGIIQKHLNQSANTSGFGSAWLDFSDLIFTYPPSYLKETHFTAQVTFQFFEHEGISIGKLMPLENTSFNVIYSEISGARYTPTTVVPLYLYGTQTRVIARRNSLRMPNQQNIDMKMMKTLAIAKRYKVSGYLVVTNLLNTMNTADVYTATGSPFSDGYLETANAQGLNQRQLQEYETRDKDNFYLESPRQITIGFTFDF